MGKAQQLSTRTASTWDFISAFGLFLFPTNRTITQVDFLPVALLSSWMCNSWENIASCLMKRSTCFAHLSWSRGSGRAGPVTSHLEMSLWTQYHYYQNKGLAELQVEPIVCTGVFVCTHAWLLFVCLHCVFSHVLKSFYDIKPNYKRDFAIFWLNLTCSLSIISHLPLPGKTCHWLHKSKIKFFLFFFPGSDRTEEKHQHLHNSTNLYSALWQTHKMWMLCLELTFCICWTAITGLDAVSRLPLSLI